MREFRADTGVGAGVLHLEGHERGTWRGCPGAVASWAACKRVTLFGGVCLGHRIVSVGLTRFLRGDSRFPVVCLLLLGNGRGGGRLSPVSGGG